MKQTAQSIFLILLFIVHAQVIRAQTDAADSLLHTQDPEEVRHALDLLPPDSSAGNGHQGLSRSPRLSGFVAPAALMLGGLSIYGKNGLYSSYRIRQDLRSIAPDFYTPLDAYTQYIPVVAAYATGFIPGAKPRHSNTRRLWMFLQAQVITSVGVMALKHYTRELRPNGEDYKSFPSGHTTQAFMGAALFDLEYPGQFKGVKIGLYGLAAATGMMAALNDRHWASDVLFGAGMGVLTVRLLYWSEQHWKKKKRTAP